MSEPARTLLTKDSVPRIARHAKLRFDETRQRWMLLVPEKILNPSDTAVEILQLCDGARDVHQIATSIAASYAAPVDDILADILPLLQSLADKGHVVT
jgi:pyrroloquinoline quinone biosynthesis protein D